MTHNVVESLRPLIVSIDGLSFDPDSEVLVTAGATAGLNLLATAFGNASLERGGEAAKRFALKPGAWTLSATAPTAAA